MVIAGIERVGGVSAEILRVARKVLAYLRQHDLPVGHGQQAHHGCEDQRRTGDAPAGHTGREQCRELVVPLQPRQRKHGAGQGDHRTGGVEKGDQPVAVVGPQHPSQTARPRGMGDEFLDVREGVDHEREPGQAHEHDHERMQLGSGDVAVDEHERLTD